MPAVNAPPRTVAIPRLLRVDGGLLASAGRLLEDSGFDIRRAFVGSGGSASLPSAETVVDGLRAARSIPQHCTDLDGSLSRAAELASVLIESGATVAIAVGGGRVIDTVKLAAARTGTCFVSIPTAIAHDGISSPVASLWAAGRRSSYAAAMPDGVLVDTEVIRNSPLRSMRAGVGDLASNLVAVLDWRLADAAGRDRYDEFSAMIAEKASRPVLDIKSLLRHEDQDELAKGLVLSGLAMAAAGTSRPCSGAEHLVSHSLDRMLGPRAGLHGEQVGLGCLIAAAAHRSPLLEPLRALFTRVGLPVAPEQLGIARVDLLAAVRDAPATRPDRYTVLDTVNMATPDLERLAAVAFDGLSGVDAGSSRCD